LGLCKVNSGNVGPESVLFRVETQETMNDFAQNTGAGNGSNWPGSAYSPLLSDPSDFRNHLRVYAESGEIRSSLFRCRRKSFGRKSAKAASLVEPGKRGQ